MIHKKGVERQRHNFPQKAFYLVYICSYRWVIFYWYRPLPPILLDPPVSSPFLRRRRAEEDVLIRSDIHGKKCHPLDSSFLLGWVQIWDNVAPGGRSQITNFVVLARRSISTTHRVLVAEERRDQVVPTFQIQPYGFFRHVHEVVVRIIIFNLLEKKL